MALSLWQQFEQQLSAKPLELSTNKIYVGLSGGLDSSLLLYLCCKVFGSENVTALHVNHQLSENAPHWQSHCELVCAQWQCNFICQIVDVENSGRGIEAAARDARYSAYDELVEPGSLLLLGHHLDDQVETFFLRLFRGSGLSGLQSMPDYTKRGDYHLGRPLLAISREEIEQHATAHGLTWIDDESNQNLDFDRNFLRHSVLPLIGQRWSRYPKRIQAVIARLQDLESMSSAPDINLEDWVGHEDELKLQKIDSLSNAQTRTLVYQWLTHQRVQVPSTQRLNAVVNDVILAQKDRQPMVQFGSGTVRRYNEALYYVEDLGEVGAPPQVELDEVTNWPGVGVVTLKTGLEASFRIRAGLPNLRWALRKGGETLHPNGRVKSRDLKRLFQEAGHKTWLRDRTPLLFSGDQLVAVGDLFIDARFVAEEGQPGMKIVWQIVKN